MTRGGGTGGAGGPGPPLELKIYRVKILKIHKMSFFLLFGAPLDKICSAAPVYIIHTNHNDIYHATLDYGSALWYWEFPQLKYWLNLLDFGIEKNFSFIIVD